jgi:hypothetical protein
MAALYGSGNLRPPPGGSVKRKVTASPGARPAAPATGVNKSTRAPAPPTSISPAPPRGVAAPHYSPRGGVFSEREPIPGQKGRFSPQRVDFPARPGFSGPPPRALVPPRPASTIPPPPTFVTPPSPPPPPAAVLARGGGRRPPRGPLPPPGVGSEFDYDKFAGSLSSYLPQQTTDPQTTQMMQFLIQQQMQQAMESQRWQGRLQNNQINANFANRLTAASQGNPYLGGLFGRGY